MVVNPPTIGGKLHKPDQKVTELPQVCPNFSTISSQLNPANVVNENLFGKERFGDFSMTRSRRIAGLKVSRIAPSTTHHKSLPELAPPEERLRSQKLQIFSSDAISLSHASAVEDVFDPEERPERNDLTARLTVYVLNMTIMVFTVPVGIALLLMNILGGENLRTTSHAMALTGLFSALAAANPELASMLV